MIRRYFRVFVLVSAFTTAGLSVTSARADDSLDAARELYVSAAYEDALAVLERLRATPQTTEGNLAIERYRAKCLLALGRTPEAEQIIEWLVLASPSYAPSETDESPRVRVVFTDVRRRVLPSVIQQQYAHAKAAYDKKEYLAARDGFGVVLQSLADPDLRGSAENPPLSDLGMLASGFRDLSVKALEPPPPPPPPVVQEPPPVQAASPAPSPAAQIYSAESAGVTPPVPVRQVLPSFPGAVTLPLKGVLEIVVDEEGKVESAAMRARINPAYDRLVLASAADWKYRPATINGVAVKFRKFISINVGTGNR